jgi:hypothetical protein
MRLPILALAVALLALPAPALAGVTLTEFKVEPASLQAGGHPDVKVTLGISPTGSDDVKDSFTRLQPGLLGNPQNAAFCTSERMRTSQGCPEEARVGSVAVSARLGPLYLPPDVPVEGTVYNLTPTGGEPARLGLVLEALGGLQQTYLEAPVYLRPGADGIGLETLFAEQPRDAGGLDIQIRRVELTFAGQASEGPFMRMPTSCAPGSSLARIDSWDAPGVFSEATTTIAPTGCDALGFTPQADGSLGAPGETRMGDFPPLTTTLRLDPEQAALNRAEVTLPSSLAPSPAAVARACPRPQAAAAACPESSRMGTAIIDSPLQAQPVRGPVYLAYNNPSQLPGLIVVLPPPVDLRIDGLAESGVGLRNIFPANPDLPLRSFTLAFGGGPSGIVRLSKDLCDPKTPTAIGVKLTSHAGHVREFQQELATPGCDPRAKIRLVRARRSWTLTALLQAARRGPDIRSAKVGLPKALKTGRRAPRVHVDGDRQRIRRPRRALRPKLGDGARRVKVVWKGLKTRRKLKKTVVVPVTMVDERGKRFPLKIRVPRG